MSQSKQSAGRRLSTITIDQIIAGASNVLIAVLAARMLGVGAFGLFGIVFIVYMTAQGISRALICDPLLVHPVEARERPGDVIGAARVLGLGIGAVVCAIAGFAWIWDSSLGGALLILGLAMPALVLQDLGRYLGMVTHRPSFALILDLLWLGLMIVALGIVVILDAETLVWFVAAWAGSGAIAGAVAPWRYRRYPMQHSPLWLRETWGFSWRYLIAFGATQGSALLSSIGLAAISGVRSLGAVRGALLLVRPSATLQSASIAAGIAEVSHMPPGSHDLRRHIARTTVLTTAVALVNLVVLVFLPDPIGEAVLGATWEPTKDLLLPASLQMVLLALISGPRAALLGQRAISLTLRIDVASTALFLVATMIGAVVNDALGAYWALVICQSAITVVWWITLRWHSRSSDAPVEPDDEVVPPVPMP